jgi:alkylation response protein AidB-like acyl-CoA dehydrogenase
VALETTARQEGNEWVINGRKRWPGNAVWCDYVVVYARDVADKQVKAFVVEKDNPGSSVSAITPGKRIRCTELCSRGMWPGRMHFRGSSTVPDSTTGAKIVRASLSRL